MDLTPRAVLFDMDGTIIDTEPFWLEAEMDLAARHGVKWDLSDALKQVGQGLRITAKNMQDAGIPLTIDEMVVDMIDFVVSKVKLQQPWCPGALELIQEVREAGIPTALVTMSYNRLANQVLDSIGFKAFDAVVTGDSVKNPKPHPEPYLKAAELLEVAIEDCVAFEDSVPGIRSAAASGAVAIAVPNHVPIPESPDYTQLDSLRGFTLDHLIQHYNSRVSRG